ncbi:MAG: alpha/beta fold hydrolase [Bacteroidota bacterium]
MPIFEDIPYQPPLLLNNRHLHSAFPVFFRQLPPLAYNREKIILRDGDFIDLDVTSAGNEKVVLLIHGFEGNSQSVYMRAMAQVFFKRRWDVVSMNLRGCSGEANHLFRSYHSGETGDLHEVIEYVINKKKYTQVTLVGFSLGANILLKYLGEQGVGINDYVKASIAVSAPCDLDKAEQGLHSVYAHWFLKSLIPKIKEKMKVHPNNILGSYIPKIKSIREFDDFYTAPVHGYNGVDDYYAQCSSIHFISKIKIPTLLLSAEDDPFLAPECIPYNAAERSEYFFLMSPKKGGHVAFVQFGQQGEYWAEKEAIKFAEKYTGATIYH